MKRDLTLWSASTGLGDPWDPGPPWENCCSVTKSLEYRGKNWGVQYSSVAQMCLTLCNSMDYSMPGFPVFHYLSELAQTHVHWVCDAIQPWQRMVCHSLLLLPSIFPSIRIFSNELALHIRWPKYWSFSFSTSPSSEYSGLICFRIDWFDLLRSWKLESNNRRLCARNWINSKFFSASARTIPYSGKDWRQEEKGTTGWNWWMASLTQWTWVWASSESWWWTGKPGELQSMGMQRVGHDWVTELSWKLK